jgi:hypothetical protein
MIWWGRRSAERAADGEALAPTVDAAAFTELYAIGIHMPAPAPDFVAGREESLEQLLAAFRDIADRDDIHQAAERLRLVLDWIGRDAACAAADPLFAPIRLAS